MKKIVNIMVAILLVTIIIPITSAAAKEEVNSNDGTKWNIATQCDDIGICDCENSYSSHNKNLSNELNKKGIESKILTCNCGSEIFARVAHTGDWNYSKDIVCKHGRKGMDYIYIRRIIISYDCNRCDYYAEVDLIESKTVCKGD
ncbi:MULTISPECIES: hypothetical protein [Clostridium]|uniref:Secreted protein n=2 Tax=Clostridium TaxID=1485 RepID=A0ABN1LNK2_9CLOT|nr:hypothetical protein [Clostridium baratii]AQM60474.1 hypothetical protein NPD11_695 [Clostridium baratii]MBT9831648.1 hypothetical protein [Clostridium baratii]MDY3206137.1 hypothetical protein [Clostridium baratii]STA99947.1 Uncharacterised protein [Clostridium baratii]